MNKKPRLEKDSKTLGAKPPVSGLLPRYQWYRFTHRMGTEGTGEDRCPPQCVRSLYQCL